MTVTPLYAGLLALWFVILGMRVIHQRRHSKVSLGDGGNPMLQRAIRALGARIVEAPFHDWFEIFDTRTYPGMDGRFVHAFSDPDVMAGNATT